MQKEGVQVVDFRFMDFPGLWQHFSIPICEFGEDTFEEGLGFDGSSIRGWQAINESDMIVKPDPTTAFIDPFMEHTTLVLVCDICDPITGEDYTRDPRHIAKKARNYMRSTGLADTIYFGPEAEFSCSMISVSIRTRIPATISSTRWKVPGIPVARKIRTLATSLVTKRVISLCRQQIQSAGHP